MTADVEVRAGSFLVFLFSFCTAQMTMTTRGAALAFPQDPVHELAMKKCREDNETIQAIDKDVRRTCPDFAFFQYWSTYVHI
jgi:hypothetical protein